jgi:AAA15 family ATPase/GTPase
MSPIPQLAFKIKNYKCFGDQLTGFEVLCPMNLIVGRNNSGKSSLLELVEYLTSPKDLSSLAHQGKRPEVVTLIDP